MKESDDSGALTMTDFFHKTEHAQETVLVTGGCGFIGGHFVDLLQRNTNASIVVVDKLTYASDLTRLQPLLERERATFIQCDIGDASRMLNILNAHRVDKIVNFAAESHVDRSIDQPEPFIDSNVVGAQRLAEAAFQYWSRLPDGPKRLQFRFLQVSTDEVYGSCEGTAFRECQPYCPTSPYAASKAAADHLVMSYFRTYELPVIISIASNNFGPYQFPEKLIPLMIYQAVTGLDLPIYGNGQQQRDWLYVKDHCAALSTILKKGTPGESYNIASGICITNLDLVLMLCELIEQETGCVNLRTKIKSVVDRPGHDQCYRVDATKAKVTLAWNPTSDFRGRLLETVRWYLKNREWMHEKKRTMEIDQRIGLRGAAFQSDPMN